MPKAGRWLLLAVVVVAAIWWIRARPVPQTPAAAVPPATSARGAPARLRLQSFALSLNPLKMSDVESRQVASLLHVGLVIQTQDGATRPAIASAWKQDGLSWEFTLKPDLSFSDGTPLKDQDIVRSLCAAMQPSSPWAWALASIRHELSTDGKQVVCSGLSVRSPGTVRIEQTASVPWFLDAISGPAGWVTQLDAAEGQYGVVPGLGPYTVREVVADTRIALAPRTSGAAVAPRLEGVQFDYLADDAVAAESFRAGRLDVLDLTSPQLVGLLTDPGTGTLKAPGTLTRQGWDRVRIAIVNEKSLARKGFSAAQARRFLDAFSAATDRQRLAAAAGGIAQPLYSGFPAVSPGTAPAPTPATGLPNATLTIITEADAYSDLIAASLPKQVGSVAIGYRGVEKGALIQALVTGEFDIASILIEATARSPEFWKSFFAPGNPFTAFGKAIPGLEKIDVSTDEGVAAAASLVAREGNWIGLLKESRWQAVAPGVTGILFSPSGQTNLVTIARE